MLKKILIGLVFLKTCSLYAQNYSPDSVAENFLKNFYNSQRGNEAALYNGKLHYAYPSQIEGIAYFLSDDWQTGTVTYENIRYDNVLMKYDLVKDQLVITSQKEGGVDIALFSPRVSEFSFPGAKFIYFQKKPGKTTLSEGFYQQLAQGKVTLFARRAKTIDESIVASTLYRKFEEKDKYYIFKNGQYYPVNTKSDLLSVLREHRGEIEDFLHEMGLNYRREPQRTIISAVEQYNQKEN